MATGTIYGTTSSADYICRVVWSSAPNVKTGTSELTLTLSYKWLGTSGGTTATGRFRLMNVGSVGSIVFTNHNWYEAMRITQTIPHDKDGTKTLEISASGSMTSCYTGAVLVESTTCQGVAELDKIPTFSEILSVGDITLGSTCAVRWKPADASFGYTLSFSIGEKRTESALILPNTTAEYLYTGHTVPLDMASEITENKTGRMSVLLTTYRDTETMLSAGTSTAECTATVPENELTAPTAEFAIIHMTPEPFEEMYLQGVTRVQGAFTEAKAKYGAKVVSCALLLENKEYGTPYLSDEISGKGEITVKGIVTDSRGISGEYTQTLNVTPYHNPMILPMTGASAILCARCDENGALLSSGTYLKIGAKKHYSDITGVDAVNDCVIRFRHKASDAEDFSDWMILSPFARSVSMDVESEPLRGIVPYADKSYQIELGVLDLVGRSSSVIMTVPTDTVALHLGEGGIMAAFGKYAEIPYCLEIEKSWSTYMPGDVYGRVFGLGKCRTALSKGDDLNGILEFGVYAIPDEETAKTLLHAPSERAGRLVVCSADGSGGARILQEYINDTGERYSRLINGEMVGEWKQ